MVALCATCICGKLPSLSKDTRDMYSSKSQHVLHRYIHMVSRWDSLHDTAVCCKACLHQLKQLSDLERKYKTMYVSILAKISGTSAPAFEISWQDSRASVLLYEVRTYTVDTPALLTVPSTHKFTLARACIRVERESRASQLASAISPRYARCCERHSNTYLRHTYR